MAEHDALQSADIDAKTLGRDPDLVDLGQRHRVNSRPLRDARR
ncbi:hypothetical protein [Streptomyces lydicus]